MKVQCKNCYSILPEEAKYCPECGAPLSSGNVGIENTIIVGFILTLMVS